MNPGRPRIAATATTLALAISLTACNGTPEAKTTPTPKPATLADATRVLAADGQAIIRAVELEPDKTDDRTGVDDTNGCPSGTARHRYTLTYETAIRGDIRSDLTAGIRFMNRRVKAAGYAKVRDQNQRDEDGRDIFVTLWRKVPPGTSFAVTVRAKGPTTSEQVIAGQTDCLR